MKKVLLLTALLLCISCKEGSNNQKHSTTEKSVVKTVKDEITGEVITWGYDGPEALYATITIKTTDNDTIYGFFLDEYGEAAMEFHKISSDIYGEVSSAYKGKTVVAKVTPPPHAYSLDKSDKTVLFTAVTKK